MNETMTVWSCLGTVTLAGLVFFVACVVPGVVVVKRLCPFLPALEVAAIAPVLGIALFVAFYLVASIVGLQGLVYAWLILALLAFAWDLHRRPPSTVLRPLSSVLRPHWDVLLLALAGIVVQARFMVGSGWCGPNGLIMLNANASDATAHLCLIREYAWRCPADAPGFAGVPLAGYHVFSDLLWAGIVRALPVINVFHVYFRVAPLVYSALITLTVFAATLSWSGSRPVARLAAVLTLLSSNFGYVLPLLFPGKAYPTWDSVFLVQPPATTVVNPPTALSFAIVLAGLWALTGWLRERRRGHLVALALTWGLLPGFKAYAAAIVMAALLFTAILLLVIRRDRSLLLPLTVVFPVSLLTFASMGRSGLASPIQWMPGLNLATMFTLPGWMNVMSPGELASLYGRQPALAALIIGALIPVFIVGNLGMRAAALWPMARSLLVWRKADPIVLFITVLTGGAVTAAVLFIQKGTIFDTVQFVYYAVLLAALPAAAQYMAWSARCRPAARYALLAAIVLLGLPALVQAWTTSAMVREKYWIRPTECEAYAWINRSTPPDTILLRPLPPELASPTTSKAWIERQDSRLHTATPNAWARQAQAGQFSAPAPVPAVQGTLRPAGWGDSQHVAALTGRNTYLEHVRSAACRLERSQWISRVEEVQQFYDSATAEQARQFIRRNDIGMVLAAPCAPLPFDTTAAGMTLLFSNRSVNVYATERSRARPTP
jgi:hypothetical protein